MIRAHQTRIRNANPGSSIARALAQHDGATQWAYNRRQSGSCRFPRFHRRGNRKSVSFSSHVGNGRRVQWPDQRHITLSSIGTLTLAEPLPEVGWVQQVHAVREGGRWYAVPVYENGGQLPDASGAGEVVGVDVGIKVLAFTSDGEEYHNSRWRRRGERKLRHINKASARSIKLNPNRRTNRRGRPNARIDLSVRLYRCHLCGWQCDRDQNAALNLKQVAPALWATVIWATIKGRGGDVSPAPGPATASEASIGQGNHRQPPGFLVDGEIVAGYSDYAKS